PPELRGPGRPPALGLIDYWVPEDRVEALQEQLQVPLQAWVDQGYVHATEGDVIDYAAVKAKAVGDARHYDLQRISYDRMFAGHIVQEIDQAARGVDLVPVGQGFVGIGPAAKEFERLINGGLVILPDDPVSRWMALWVETKTDETDSVGTPSVRVREVGAAATRVTSATSSRVRG
ncbi:terminase TerL endonuclease subunit, partial [Micrococcus sp. F3Y]|uniref:terminase TerL endonuclease subunit n=1 Tax=Micrococcus sp. F3Y TaxID=3402627 RepID=UPI003AF7E992